MIPLCYDSGVLLSPYTPFKETGVLGAISSAYLLYSAL